MDSSSLTDRPDWRQFCVAAAADLSLLESDPDGVLNDVVGGIEMREGRYRRIAGEINRTFGSMNGRRVLEVGGGYGGQAFASMLWWPRVEWSVIDLPEAFALQQAYLERAGFRIRSPLNRKHSLAVSCYAVSEIRRDTQIVYLREMARCRRGYIRWNGWTTRELELDEVLALLPAGTVATPEPEDDRNRIIVWGHE